MYERVHDCAHELVLYYMQIRSYLEISTCNSVYTVYMSV